MTREAFSRLLEAALDLGARGFRVLPLHTVERGVCSCPKAEKCLKSAGKHPRFGGWQEQASSDPRRIRTWWGKWPTANIGLAMGGPGRVVALDVDGPEGRATLARLEREHGPLPVTLTSRSGRADGGEHRFYRVPDALPLEAIANGVGRARASNHPGIDVRADGAQVVAPPSVHYTGNRYAWVDLSVPIADLPEWLFALLTAPPSAGAEVPQQAPSPPREDPSSYDVRVKRAAAYLAKVPGAVEGEHGGTATFLVAQKLTRGFDLDEETAFGLLRDDFNARCRPPWALPDLRRKVAQAAREGTITRGSLLVDRDPPPTPFRRSAEVAPSAPAPAREALAPVRVPLLDFLREAPAKAFEEDVLHQAAELDELGVEFQAVLALLRTKRLSVRDWRAAVRSKRPAAAAVAEAEPDELGEVRAALLCNDKGAPRKHVANVVTILARDPRWEGRIAYHAMRETPVITRAIDWHADDAPAKPYTGPWRDVDSTSAASWLARAWGFDVGSKLVSEAIEAVSRRVVIDPLRDYLTSLRWDGEERLPWWTSVLLGAPKTPYTEAVGSRWLISAVARALRPGEKVDCVLVLEGLQGTGKSSFLRSLCPTEDLFGDDELAFGNKDAAQSLSGKWIWELGELDKMSRHDLGILKAFISRQTDTYRPSYGIRARDFPRSTVFAASVNEPEYLRDTENRRYWPMPAPKVTLCDPWLRDQLWAEAVARHERGEPWYVDTPELAAMCRSEQERRAQADPWEEHLAKWCAGRLEEACQARIIGARCPCPRCAGVTTSAALTGALGVDRAKQTRAEEGRAATILRALGWTKGQQLRQDGTRVRPFYPPVHQEDAN